MLKKEKKKAEDALFQLNAASTGIPCALLSSADDCYLSVGN